VAIRPLEVKELADVLAVDFDDADGMPKFKTNWRWEDEEQALLSSCSSLITIVGTRYSRVVQFSHFSVKEFLTSARLATSSVDVSRYHIVLEPAHTILAQACMSVLLQPDDGVEENGVAKRSPLAGYAAEHWVTHAQFERVSSLLRKAMEYLFDLNKPYFAAWLQLHNIDIYPNPGSSSLCFFAVRRKSDVTPLYLAALCGFQDLVEHLVVKYPQYMNTTGGHYVTPLVAALAGRHFQTAKHLHDNGAHVNVRGESGRSPLHSAATYGDLEVVQVLLDYKADASAQNEYNWAPIHDVSSGDYFQDRVPNISVLQADVARLLLERGADLNAQIYDGSTPLHLAAKYGRVDVVRVLLEHDAKLGAEDNKGGTPLHAAARRGTAEVVRVLLEHGANACAEDSKRGTPLHATAEYGSVEVVRVLLEHGANVRAEDNEGGTPLHRAARYENIEVVRMLLEHGANACAEDNKRGTPLHAAARSGNVEVVRMLLAHGANACAEDSKRGTPLYGAAQNGSVEVVRMLLEHGANACAEDNERGTPLHGAAEYENVEVVRVLLEHGANVRAEDNKGRTPFQIASGEGETEIVELLSEHSAHGV
jgi:ankyrin repeat protein